MKRHEPAFRFAQEHVRAMRDVRFIQVNHLHPDNNLFVVLEGQAEFTIAGESGIVGPGQMCVARAGEWHEIRTLDDQPVTLYPSVTPHIEPTHTQWDHKGGMQLPYRYGGSSRAERLAAA
jgi:mannose-6-phosphate isomerase-like protein (cupin superfamily)